ncbi:unnamed protein product, partial [Closterium sp. Yama58-4]
MALSPLSFRPHPFQHHNSRVRGAPGPSADGGAADGGAADGGAADGGAADGGAADGGAADGVAADGGAADGGAADGGAADGGAADGGAADGGAADGGAADGGAADGGAADGGAADGGAADGGAADGGAADGGAADGGAADGGAADGGAADGGAADGGAADGGAADGGAADGGAADGGAADGGGANGSFCPLFVLPAHPVHPSITTLGSGGHPARVVVSALDLAGSSGAGTTGGGAGAARRGGNGGAASAFASAAGAMSGGGGSGRRGSSRQRLGWRMERQFVSHGSVWACECSSRQGEIGVGTSLGAQLLQVETGQRTALCHSNSDVLALQVTGEGSVCLAGFRNGAIATIDTRAPLPTSMQIMKRSDFYLFASSFDGSLFQWDLRSTASPLRQLQGHVNSHLRLPLLLDPSENFLCAPGNDSIVRIWSVSTGALLSAARLSDNATAAAWPSTYGLDNGMCDLADGVFLVRLSPSSSSERHVSGSSPLESQLSLLSGTASQQQSLSSRSLVVLKLAWQQQQQRQRFLGESRLAKVPIERIRNFSIIAHIDHGKSTLADKLLETTGTVQAREMKEQFLDNMELERERGITIKLQAARMRHVSRVDGKAYCLNLIDTPGHVDFSYEVSRSLAACEGALLVVDASQGVEAQTLANVYLAIEGNLEIIPVLNKIDLPGADPERVRAEVEEVVGLDASDAILCSAKEGVGIQNILEAIIAKVPPPAPTRDQPLRCLIFDSYYDPYRGVIVYFRVVDGEVRKGDSVRFMASGKQYEVDELGVLSPTQMPVDCLYAGEVGYLAASIRQVADARVGDTITHAGGAGKGGPPAKESLPGYREAVPMVFCGLFPIDADQFPSLREALEKLQLNDAALQFEPESSSAMGFGFRCGFLGLLHMDVVQERLEREYGLDLITTAPSVVYRVVKRDGSVVECSNPADMPDAS